MTYMMCALKRLRTKTRFSFFLIHTKKRKMAFSEWKIMSCIFTIVWIKTVMSQKGANRRKRHLYLLCKTKFQTSFSFFHLELPFYSKKFNSKCLHEYKFRNGKIRDKNTFDFTPTNTIYLSSFLLCVPDC